MEIQEAWRNQIAMADEGLLEIDRDGNAAALTLFRYIEVTGFGRYKVPATTKIELMNPLPIKVCIRIPKTILQTLFEATRAGDQVMVELQRIYRDRKGFLVLLHGTRTLKTRTIVYTIPLGVAGTT